MADTFTILMAAYPFPPYQWAGGASIRLVKFLKYMTALRPRWDIEVVTAGYGAGQAAMAEVTADLLAEVPASVKVHRIDDPALVTWPTASAPRRALARMLRPFSPATAERLAPPMPELPEAVPDRYTGWAKAVLAWACRQAGRGKRYDLVYASCPPYSTAVLGAELKALFGCRLVVDVKDNWITSRHALPAPRAAAEERLERRVMQDADAVICVTPDALEAYGRSYPDELAGKLRLITNGVDLADFECVYGDAGEPRETFSITYAGSLGGENRSPEPFFKAFKMLLECEGVRADACEAVFPASMPEAFWSLGEALGLGGHLKRGEVVDREAYVRRLNASQVLLSINYRGETTLIPGKLYEYWAAGRPILLIETPGAATALVRRYGLGLCADCDDVAAIFDCLWELWRQYDAGEKFQPRTAGLAAFSRQALAASLCEVFEQLEPTGEPEPRNNAPTRSTN